MPDRMPDGSPWPLVSVVTPSYNQVGFIEETIRSVLLQGYPNLEYIVVDGGSTDGSIEIIHKYEPWLAYWVSEPDEGQAHAINKGFGRARGDILAWLNSDDTYLPGAVQTQVKALLHHKECGIVYGDALYIDQNSKPLYIGYGRPYSITELLRFSIPAQPTTFVWRRVYERIGSLNIAFRYSLDSEYWLRASRVTNFWYETKCVATYRLHGTSKTVAGHERFHKEWMAIAESFFQEPDVAEACGVKKAQVIADVYTRIAIVEAERGSLSEAFHYLLKALRTRGPSLMMLKLLPLLVDRYLPFRVTPKLMEWWHRISRLRPSGHLRRRISSTRS